MRDWLFGWVVLYSILCFGSNAGASRPVLRRVVDLSGVWRIVADPEDRGRTERWYEAGRFPEGKRVQVPAAWETALGTDYDGVAWYARDISVPAFGNQQRVLLRFHGAATAAQVWVGGTSVGGHTGPWTPFTLDVTSAVRAGRTAQLVVRLDEKVGHNTQGFLPIIAPHFAGLWQKVELIVVSRVHLDDTRIAVDASDIDLVGGTANLRASAPVVGDTKAIDSIRFTLWDSQGREIGSGPGRLDAKEALWQWSGMADPWDLGRPRLYRLRIELCDRQEDVLDAAETSLGFRKVTTDGPRILLNGKDLIVRGFLTWGYYPPLLAPAPEPARFRRQLRYFRDCGFNLIKFCLWLPPAELLDIVDEEGMLAWVEYPTWHPKIDRAHRDKLVAEYTEMSHHDGDHPSVILRSITCETGPSADLDVIRELYDLLKRRCPATLVVDDSSWIGWNRIHDFWDDHSYGNNRTWREALASFQKHIDTHGVKPLLLGEAIAADTWIDPAELPAAGGAEAWWLPGWLDEQRRFERKLRRRFGGAGYDPVADLRACSLKYAMDMRRWQIETYRHQMPHSGYVVSTAQDVTLCAMGLLDSLGRPKWSASDWAFHGPVMTPLNTAGDRRAFASGSRLIFEPCLRVTPEAGAVAPAEMRWSLGAQRAVRAVGPADDPAPVRLPLSSSADRPQRVHLRQTRAGKDISWELWVLPEPADPAVPVSICADADGALGGLFPGAATLGGAPPVPGETPVVVTRALSRELLDYLQAGGRVLHLTSNQSGSVKDEEIWFLRGTAWSPRQPNAFLNRCSREMLSYLQLFDLGGNTIIRGEALWEQVDPLLMFVETHDLKTVRPNLMLFETGVGKGRLIVSCLRHEGGPENNYAGFWLAKELVAHLLDGPNPARALSEEMVQVLYENLATETRDIDPSWRFTTDPNNEGMKAGFFKAGFDDSRWQNLQTRSAEEGDIWNRYDGWGWYRKTIQVPAAWKDRHVRIVFDSVDDMYRLFVNGAAAGGYGKMDRSESSFLKRTWVEVTDHIRYGTDNTLVLQIYDWVGSGGLNGKVWLTTGPVGEHMELLRR